jgi:hypothetical protein
MVSSIQKTAEGKARYAAITDVRNERENNPDDKTLFEAASRIIKLGERENLTLEKAVGCIACSKLEACP